MTVFFVGLLVNLQALKHVGRYKNHMTCVLIHFIDTCPGYISNIQLFGCQIGITLLHCGFELMVYNLDWSGSGLNVLHISSAVLHC